MASFMIALPEEGIRSPNKSPPTSDLYPSMAALIMPMKLSDDKRTSNRYSPQ